MRDRFLPALLVTAPLASPMRQADRLCWSSSCSHLRSRLHRQAPMTPVASPTTAPLASRRRPAPTGAEAVLAGRRPSGHRRLPLVRPAGQRPGPLLGLQLLRRARRRDRSRQQHDRRGRDQERQRARARCQNVTQVAAGGYHTCALPRQPARCAAGATTSTASSATAATTTRPGPSSVRNVARHRAPAERAGQIARRDERNLRPAHHRPDPLLGRGRLRPARQRRPHDRHRPARRRQGSSAEPAC